MAFAMAVSGCAFLEPIEKNLDFKIVGVSPTNGITVSVYGKTCNFSFTTDKAVIYSQIKSCAFGPVVMSSAPPAPIGIGDDGELIYPEIVVEEPELEQPDVEDPLGKLAIEIADVATASE